MSGEETTKLEEARKMMEEFALRTGISGAEGDPFRRYLWTDAFAVQTFFGLARVLEEDRYHSLALRLIDMVHETLGKFRKDDPRKGWISGLPEHQGKIRPTAGGLRIGKELPERSRNQPLDERLEWERDGQYFHYITRWINALLEAEQETGDHRYALWASDLLYGSRKFIHKEGGWVRMYWKMSVDLSRPLVPAMGAHDPLEGLVCAESIIDTAPEKSVELGPLLEDLEHLCKGHDWATSDPLGIGGLLLNTVRASELNAVKIPLPPEIAPENLLRDSLYGLVQYARMFNPKASALGRLPFRECGLSLGLRSVQALKDRLPENGLKLEKLEPFMPLADHIETFWQNPDNRNAPTWNQHLDINSVSLAASMVAELYPYVFSGVKGVL